ncbi:hypothetical protein [Halopiger xanaduensis]|uniref:Uncharacterized protein n=1 Tax=Halopiger xanaduensis (strain DSM 18323 / JCM 14033 / SH-6) TaxID=797210 RepID=F8DET3_HALXS|nr:hypothetical protein [Halopiger xanaduensis]AEH39523.1 hypothetical protein Halxa_0283 [Halopiger xanaduensis SH-6]
MTQAQTAVSRAKPYAKRFAQTYLAVAALAICGWLVLAALLMPDLVFDWVMGPLVVISSVQMVVTSTAVAGAAVAIFGAGVAYERYR